ncbi:MAG: S-layer homology domain-containing protein, partial [Oscillospiraceae bacterium]|nr:S-layer homology domain-containing protein [Oscillospiraceae bacterium]
MKRTSKPLARLLTLALTAALLLCLLTTGAVAARYPDIGGHWGETAIEKWSDYDILHGTDLGTFDPDGALDTTQLAQLLVNTFGYDQSYTGALPGYSSIWGEDAIRKAVAAGVMDASEAALTLTRELAAKIIAKAFAIAPVTGTSKFVDDYSITNEYKPYVAALGRAGIFNGNERSEFMPADSFSRAQIMQALDNAVTDVIKENKTTDSAKSIIINKTNVTLTESVIEDDLIIAQGVGDGDVTLDSVTVKGRLVVLGGGSNTIRIKGNSNIAEIIVNKTFGQAARVLIDSADATIGTATIAAESKAAIAATSTAAAIGSITVAPATEVNAYGEITTKTTPAATTLTVTAKAATVTIDAPNTALTLSSGAAIDTLVIEEKTTATISSGAAVKAATIAASDVKISGAGKLTTALVTADAKSGVEIRTSGTKVTVDKDAG